MPSCPSDEFLSGLLAGTILDSDALTVEQHLMDCRECQSRLDRMTDSPRLAAWVGDRPLRLQKASSFSAPERPGDLGCIGRYLIEAEIGRGGMGVVYRAWDQDLCRLVAVKVLRPERDDERSSVRFERESQAAAKLRHDHLVPVYGIERTTDGSPVIVMPFIVGPTLRERLRTEPTLAPREAAELVRQIAEGLEIVHTAGLVHRDVKPANILLDQSDGRAKLTDFGLAREIEPGETVTRDGIIVGTPEYLSPEQAIDPARSDCRADVYSLGVTFYECLTGVVPFRGAPFDVIARHRNEDPISPRRLVATVPADLETVCLKCLEKDPRQRYSSAAALHDDLTRWIDGRPIAARSAGRLERSLRWAKRNPMPVVIVAVSVLGCVVSALGWWQAGVNAREARASAEVARTREEEAVAARTLSDERSALALSAITTLVTKAQNLAGDQPGLLKFKQQLNEAALADLKKLTDSTDRVPGADRTTIQAHLKLGDAFNLLGKSDEAQREWHRARERAESLLAQNPDDLLTIRDLARALYSIGFTRNRLLDYPGAEKNMDESLRILEEAIRNHPDDPLILDNLGTSYFGRGDVAWLTGKSTSAIASYERSLEVHGKLLEHDPSDAKLKSKMLLARGRIGYVCLSYLHDYERGERQFREQIQAAKRQLAETPDDRDWQRNHRISMLDLSSALQRQGRFDEAEQLARDAIVLLEKAAAADLDNGLAQRDYAMGWDHLGMAQLGAGRYADAETSLKKAMTIIEGLAARSNSVAIIGSTITTLCFSISLTIGRQGRSDEAATWIDRIIVEAKKLYGPGTLSLDRKNYLARMERLRDALKLAPMAHADAAFAESKPPELMRLLMFARIFKKAQSGEIALARMELSAFESRFPTALEPTRCRACVEGFAASRAATPEEKTRAIEAGTTAMMDAIRRDVTWLESIYMFPELVPIRTSPGFKSQLKDYLASLNR